MKIRPLPDSGSSYARAMCPRWRRYTYASRRISAALESNAPCGGYRSKFLQKIRHPQPLLLRAAHVHHDPALVHHDQPVAHVNGLAHRMRHHQGRRPSRAKISLVRRITCSALLGQGSRVLVQQQLGRGFFQWPSQGQRLPLSSRRRLPMSLSSRFSRPRRRALTCSQTAVSWNR